MRATSPVINLDTARVAKQGQVVTFTDPTSPWTVRLRVRGDVREIVQIVIDVKPGRAPVTKTRLDLLPLEGMLHLAAAHTAHPNEAYYRMLARPRRPGQVHWDAEHWEQVLAVYDWAETTARPGGGRRAIADLWGVSVDPTVRRWMITARNQAAGGAGPVSPPSTGVGR